MQTAYSTSCQKKSQLQLHVTPSILFVHPPQCTGKVPCDETTNLGTLQLDESMFRNLSNVQDMPTYLLLDRLKHADIRSVYVPYQKWLRAITEYCIDWTLLPQFYSIAITGYERTDRGFIVFTIVLYWEDEELTFYRRFSEFDFLFTTLELCALEEASPTMGQQDIPEPKPIMKPSKTWFPRYDDIFLKKRMDSLAFCTNQVLKVEENGQKSVVREFFMLDL